MGGPKFLFVVVLALLAFIPVVPVASAAPITAFPLEGNEWIWCFGKANIGSRLSSDIASSEIASADLKWMNPRGYVVDDALIAGSGPYYSYNELLSGLQDAYNYLDGSARSKSAGDIYGKAATLDGISSGISKYQEAISVQIEGAMRAEMERTGLERVEEVVPLGLEKTSAAKFYERISDEGAPNAIRSTNIADVERFESEWGSYIGEYAEFAEAERFVLFDLGNCSMFSSVSLAMCNFDDAVYWICDIVTPGCLPLTLCKGKFERDAVQLKTSPPNARETMANLKLHSPLQTLKEEYSEFVSLMAKARETEASLKADDGRLADSVEGLLIKAEGEELRLIDAKIADKIYSASNGNNNNAAGLSSILKAKAQVRLSSFSETIDKTANSLEGDREVLGKISGSEEKYSEESRAGLYNRIKDLKIINERLAGEKTALSEMLEDAVKLDESASAAVEEMKASLLGNDALWPLDRLRISNIAAYKKGSSTGMSVLAKYETILELERIAKRIGEAQNSAIESQLEEIEDRTEELRLLLDVAGSPIEKTFGNGMHGEGLLRGKLGKIAATLDGVKSDISKIRRNGDIAEKNLLILALGMKLDAALDELWGLNDEMHEKPLNAARFSARTALDNAVSAGIPVDEERKQFAEYERHFAGSDWIDSSSGAFGFMGWLEAGYEDILKDLTEKFDEASESFFSALPVDGSYAFPDSAIPVANSPTLVRASFTISNPSSIAGGSRLYSTKLERLPFEKIGSKNVIDSSDGVDGVYSGGEVLYLKAKYLKPRGTESALVEYYAEPAVTATVASKSEKATVWKYSLEENITVTCGIRTAEIEVPVQSQLFTAGAGLKITAISPNGRALEWLNTPDGIAVKSSCLAGNHSIRFAAEFAEPIDVSVSRELKSSAGGLTSSLHRLELRNRLGIELRDVEMEYELPPGAGDVKINGKTTLLADGTSTLYWKESRFASYGSASATVTFSTTATNVTDTLLLDQEIDSIINSLPKCDWESCCDIKKLLEDENGKAKLAGDPVARYLAKSDFLSWLKKNSPFIDIFSIESAREEYKDLASAKAEMCSLKISKAIEAVRKAEAEKKKRDKEEKTAISAKALILRREARMLDERLGSLQATAKAFPGLLKDDAASLTELKRFSDETTEDLILAETEGNATRLSEAEARLARLKEGIGSEAKKMADIIYGVSNPSNNNGKAFVISVPENITAKVEERFPGVVVTTVQPENATRTPSGFEKSYSNGDYEGALKIALDGGLEKETGLGTTFSKDANGKIALAVSKLAELERLAKIKQAPSKGEAAGYLEDAKSAYGEGRFADASYLALYAYSAAEDEISELAGLKTPVDVRPMAALALLLAAGFVIHIKQKQKSKKMMHSRKPTVSAIKPEKESEQQQQDSVFFGELK